MYNANGQIKFKTIMLTLSSCDYSDSFIFMKGILTITEEGAETVAEGKDETYKQTIFKNCAHSLTNCISEINNA